MCIRYIVYPVWRAPVLVRLVSWRCLSLRSLCSCRCSCWSTFTYSRPVQCLPFSTRDVDYCQKKTSNSRKGLTGNNDLSQKQWHRSGGKLLCIDGGGLCHQTAPELGKFRSGPTKSRSVRKHFCYWPLSEPESSGSVRIVGFDHRPLTESWCNDYKNRSGLFT